MFSKPRIATVTTLKAPLEETLSFVSYHLNSGIDHMYLFFDDPNDDAISHISDHRQLTCFRCTQDYWKNNGMRPGTKIQLKQRTNATLAFKYARAKNIEWLVHLDSDELLFSKTSFKKLFSDISDKIDVIRFPVLEAIPQQLKYEHPFQDIHLFKAHLVLKSSYNDFTILPADQKKQLKRAKFWYRRKKLYHILANNIKERSSNFLLGHTVGKAATRTTTDIRYIENHLPVTNSDKKPFIKISQNGYILHYDCQGYSSWKNKWKSRINGSANFDITRFSKQRRKQMQLFREASSKGEQEIKNLFKNLYHLTKYEQTILYLTGLLKKINHDPDLFTSKS
jgi:histidyl-tRNA synthetase